MKLNPKSSVFAKLLLGLSVVFLVILAGLTSFFLKQNQTIFAELEGARNLISLQGDRSDLLDLRIADLETRLRGEKNCNLSADQALKLGYTQGLQTSLPRIEGSSASRAGEVPVIIAVPNAWCVTQFREAYFYLSGEKYFLSLDVPRTLSVDTIVRHYNSNLGTSVLLENSDVAGASERAFTFESTEKTRQTVVVKIPTVRRSEFLALFNRILTSVRLATEEEIATYDQYGKN